MPRVAEDEAKRISDRTKAALAAYIARGGRLGNPSNLTPAYAKKGRKLAAEAKKRIAGEAYEDLYSILTEKREGGASLQEIVDYLNGEGYVTAGRGVRCRCEQFCDGRCGCKRTKALATG